MSDQPDVRHIVFHSPGPAWQRGVDFRDQPGIGGHVAHYRSLLESGRLESGGPFVTGADGGMMVAAGDVGYDELDRFAAEDPAVLSGLLTYEIRSWFTAMRAE